MSKEQKIKLPFVDGISAGFTSPARDYTGEKIDLNELLIKHPSSTFLGFADGDCLNDVGIYDGDLIICDKSLDLCQGDIAVCYVDGEFTMKRVELFLLFISVIYCYIKYNSYFCQTFWQWNRKIYVMLNELQRN